MGLASKLAAAAAGGAAAPPGGALPPTAPPLAPQQQASYPPQSQGYPPSGQQQPPSYPPGAQGYPPAAPRYPPQQAAPSYPPQQAAPSYPPAPGQQQFAGYPPQQQFAGYPPQPQQPAGAYGAPPQQAYPPQPQQPAGAYGAPPQQAYPPQPQQPAGGPAPGGGAPVISPPALLARLQTIVNANGLQRFHPPQQLEAVAARAARVDYASIAARWRMPLELALDLAALSLYDIVLYCDDSGSMAFEDNGERIEDLKVILGRVAEVSTLFDDDGILVRFMNSPVEGNGLRSAADAAALLSQVTFGGTTPLAASMASRVVNGIVLAAASRGALAKPVLVITITDGEPTDTPKDAILQVIRDTRARLSQQYGPRPVAFQFAQVGRDQRAQAFLGKLDKDPSVGDIIDCTSYFEQEAEEYARKGVNLSVEAWLCKLMLGAVDPSYDAEDEGR